MSRDESRVVAREKFVHATEKHKTVEKWQCVNERALGTFYLFSRRCTH